jgi:hypothetical protein
MPPIINLVAGDATTLIEDYGVQSASSLHSIQNKQAARLQEMFPEFPFVQAIWNLAVADRMKALFSEDSNA